MKKSILICLIVLLAGGTNIFAQFVKGSAEAAKNLENLDRVITRASKGAVLGRPVVTIPAGVVAGNTVGLLRVTMPKVVTPVTQSYIKLLNTNFVPGLSAYPTPESVADALAHEWVGKNGERVFYENQAALAKDLDAFYKGDAKVFVGVDGHKVKLYTLPVDGILYKPLGYRTPVVLNSKEYFVIYDIESKTGQIAANEPEIYNTFRPATEEELYGEFEVFEVKPGVESYRPKDPRKWYEYRKDLAKNNSWNIQSWKMRGYPVEFTSQNEMGKMLSKFHGTDHPKVKDLITGSEMFVYELPRPLTYAPEGGVAREINPSQYVVLYSEVTGGQIIERASLENSAFHKFTK